MIKSMVSPVRVLLIGSTGLLGTTLSSELKNSGFEIVTVSRSGPSDIRVDVSNKKSLFDSLSESVTNFHVVINLAALTSVERCEDRPDLAHRANTATAENIACWIKELSPSTHFIQLSTDHVYEGCGPHKESDVTLVNTYALTKFAGELAAKMVPSTILRTNFVGASEAPSRRGLTDWLYDSLTQEEHIQVLNDVLFSPVSISTLCSVITEVIKQQPVGVFNLGSSGGMSKADFDFAFAGLVGLPTKYMSRVGASTAKFLRARRPLDMRMDSSKLEGKLGIKLPSLLDEIRKVATTYERK
jgi:dTDP-4-dehydrorhamnose reductase